MDKRLGLMGGTFDPIHYGHLLLAQSCHEQCPLDQVWFLPADVPPHKMRQTLTPAAQRDPFLYWLLPNLRDDRHHPHNVRCYYLRHAGDSDWVQWPDKTWHAE